MRRTTKNIIDKQEFDRLIQGEYSFQSLEELFERAVITEIKLRQLADEINNTIRAVYVEAMTREQFVYNGKILNTFWSKLNLQTINFFRKHDPEFKKAE